jgi:hypothetical protein
MLKKKIKYVDYDGNEREEVFYFNLTKAELTTLELSTAGGLEKLIEKISAEKDGEKLIGLFQKIILMAYGEKSDDGKRFIKSEELSKAFSQTEAYSDLFMELVTDEKAAILFINSIVPQIATLPPQN